MKNRILIVNDNQEINQLVLLYLERYGFMADQATTFMQARELLQTEYYALIILDWNLDQNHTGFKLLPDIDRHTKVLLFSANSVTELVKASQKYPQINDFMSKDFRGDEMVLKIRALLDIE